MQQKTQTKRKDVFLILLVIFLALLFTALSWLFILPMITGNLRVGSKAVTQNEITRILGAFNPPGVNAGSGLSDGGCKDVVEKDVNRKVSCIYNAAKFMKNRGNLHEDFSQASQLLKGLGFRLTTPTTDGPSGDPTGHSSFYDQYGARLEYESDTPIKIKASLIYQPYRETSGDVWQLPDTAQSDWWKEHDYQYGILLSTEYYYCNSVILQPCLLAPSYSLNY